MNDIASLRHSIAEDRHAQLHELYRQCGAEMTEFQSHQFPLQFQGGMVSEHHHCRTKACFFDISHMKQVLLIGQNIAEKLEALVPSALQELKPGKARYTVLTNDQGGIRDDLIVFNAGEYFYLLLNSAMSEHNIAYMQAHLNDIEIIQLNDQALFDIQGPSAETIIDKLIPGAANLKFMETLEASILGATCRVSRIGFTGEDGFELSIPVSHAFEVANSLIAHEDLELAGLGARESLRIEAGFNLYGNDIDARTSPVEAQIGWIIQKRRIEDANFPGSKRIIDELQGQPDRKLVGIMPEGFKLPETNSEIFSQDGQKIGTITSATFSLTIGAPIAVGYVLTENSNIGADVLLSIDGDPVNARISKRPFVPHRYKR